jgi:dTDP-4-dehydrorhamnose 3,5-epimerase
MFLENDMHFENSKVIDGLVVIHPDVNYDFRGEFVETYNNTFYDHITGNVKFVIDDISVSRHKTMRGIHGDTKTIKLIQCLHGEIMQVVVDFRTDSPTFMAHEIFSINDKNRTQILIPAGCGNGHVVLSDKVIFHYKQSEYYGGVGSQFQYRWTRFVEDFNVILPFNPNRDAILSARDHQGMDLFETVSWLRPDLEDESIHELIENALGVSRFHYSGDYRGIH